MSLVKDERKPMKKRGYRLKDEEMYLVHAVENHGKRITGASPIDGVAILRTWLDTCDKRRWDFTGIETLRAQAAFNLNTLLSLARH